MEALILSNYDYKNMGGNSPDKYKDMLSSLAKGGISGTHNFVGTTENLVSLIENLKPDIVFSGAYFTEEPEPKKRKNVHSLLESLSVPYVGSTESSLELVLSKASLKNRWKEHKIQTPDYYVIKSNGHGSVAGLEYIDLISDYPYIIKPSKGGNSRGITEKSIVHNSAELKEGIKGLLPLFDEILIESFIGKYADIMEFTVSMIGNGKGMIIAPAEIILKIKKKERVITTKDKDEHFTSAEPIKDKILEKRVIDFAKIIYLSSGVSDYSRCDIIMGADNLYAIEVNGQPMIPDKWVEKCMSYAGLNKDQYLNGIILAGISRNIKEGYTNLSLPKEMENILPPEVYRILTA